MKRALFILMLGGLASTLAARGSAQPYPGGMQPPFGPQPPMAPQAPYGPVPFAPQPQYGPQQSYGPQPPYGMQPPPFGMQPPYGIPPGMPPPPYGRQPPNGMSPGMQPPPYGTQPPYGMPPGMQPPPYGTQPPYGMPPGMQRPPYGMPPPSYGMQPPNRLQPPPYGMPGAPSNGQPPYGGLNGSRGNPSGEQSAAGMPGQAAGPSAGPFAGPSQTPSKDTGPVPELPPPFGGPSSQEPPVNPDASPVPFSPGGTQNPVPPPEPDPRDGVPPRQMAPPSLNPLMETPPAAPKDYSGPPAKALLPWQEQAHGHDPDTFLGPADETPENADWYPVGSYTLQILFGGYSTIGSPSYSYTPIDIRIGKILDCGCKEGILRGYLEPILEINGAPTFGIGHFFAGGSAILRYNFVQPPVMTPSGCERCRLVPYFQVGAGLQYNDGYQDTNQTALGQALEYTFQAQVGVHYFLTHSLSLDAEAGYQLITSLQSSSNGGIMAVGGSIGLTYYLPCGAGFRR